MKSDVKNWSILLEYKNDYLSHLISLALGEG